MNSLPRILTLSTLAAFAATSLLCAAQYALGDPLSNPTPNPQPLASTLLNSPRINLSPAQPHPITSASPKAHTPAVRLKTHVLLVSLALLNKVPVAYDLKVPMHHVRPDTAETLTDATLIDDTTAARLIQIAHSGPGNLEYSPADEDYPYDQDEFDCLSDMFRGGKPLPPDLASSVVNGLSLAYNLSSAPDQQHVLFSPVTIMRADFPAAEIPNTAAHEAPYAHHVKIPVPTGGTLLIDAGPVKATRTETSPSRHLVVLVQPHLLTPTHQNLLTASPPHTPAAIASPS